MASKNVNFRASDIERHAFDESARLAGCKLSTWLRAVALVASDSKHLAEDIETGSACHAIEDGLRRRLSSDSDRAKYEVEAALHDVAAAYARLANVASSMTGEQERKMIAITTSSVDDMQVTQQAAYRDGWSPSASGTLSVMNGARRIAGPWRVDPEHTVTWHLPIDTRPTRGDPEPTTEELRVDSKLCWTHWPRSAWTRLRFEQPPVRIRRMDEAATVDERDPILGLQVGHTFHVDFLGAMPERPAHAAEGAVAALVRGVDRFTLRAKSVKERGSSLASFTVAIVGLP